MISIDYNLKPSELQYKLERFWHLSGKKIRSIQKGFDHSKGAPVFTVNGRYSTRGWTEWTQGFEYGSSILQFDATGDDFFLQYGKKHTREDMAEHLTHMGVHDHGFNNISTYGNLLRLMKEGKIAHNDWERQFYQLALKVSGAVQAARWTKIIDGGFLYSFNGPHSLFVDTIRSCRILMLAHLLGHSLRSENDASISLLSRALLHIKATADFNVYYGEGRDYYDINGRTAHEAIFNVNDGNFRCPNAQQGYSGRSTWTRGLAWAMCGFAEELELLDSLAEHELQTMGGKGAIRAFMLKAAMATCDFYIANTPACGIPYWDTGAPLLHKMGDYPALPADPYNDFEPVDSSAAAIGAQGLMRLGHFLQSEDKELGEKYFQAGLTVMDSLLDEPYISTEDEHQGLILHSIYHHPNGWDHKPKGAKTPHGESSMWGDYHAREAALYLQRLINGEQYYTFFSCVK
jgi:unsaturated chondroitin disaccharide hydrolase